MIMIVRFLSPETVVSHMTPRPFMVKADDPESAKVAGYRQALASGFTKKTIVNFAGNNQDVPIAPSDFYAFPSKFQPIERPVS